MTLPLEDSPMPFGRRVKIRPPISVPQSNRMMICKLRSKSDDASRMMVTRDKHRRISSTVVRIVVTLNRADLLSAFPLLIVGRVGFAYLSPLLYAYSHRNLSAAAGVFYRKSVQPVI